MHEKHPDAAQVSEWQRIAYLLGRTPAGAFQRFARIDMPAQLLARAPGIGGMWQDVPIAPQWAAQHVLLRAVMTLPLAQRAALAQMVFPRQLGAVSNTYALFRALVRLGRVLDPVVEAHQLVAQPQAYQCRRSRIFLANGQSHLVDAHVRHCLRCRQAGWALQRIRQAVIAVLTTATFPPLPTPTTQPMWMRWTLVGVLGAVMLLGGLWTIWSTPAPLSMPTPGDPEVLLRQALTQLYEVPVLQEGEEYAWHARVFWRFGAQRVAVVDAQFWYQQAPEQYRAQLVHEAGGNPYELDIVTAYQRLYHVTETYAPSIWPQESVATTIVRPMKPFTVRDALFWRLQQGAWSVAPHLLARGASAPQVQVMGVTVGEDGVGVVRIRTADDAGELWFDVDVTTAQVMAMWEITADEPRLVWQRVSAQVQSVREPRRYMVTQPYVGQPTWLNISAVHPALPTIGIDMGELRDDGSVEFIRGTDTCVMVFDTQMTQVCQASPAQIDDQGK